MKRIAQLALGFLLAGGAPMSVTWVMAAPETIKLLPVTAKLRPSKLIGYTAATEKCAICHSADYINYQPPGMNQTQWTAEMAKMQHVYGAPISDTEVKQIGAYLAVVYGTAKATDPSVIAASTSPTPDAGATVAAPTAGATAVAKPDAAIDVQSLLAANACLSCHALTQKIVGPAYHDVAEKYKGDAQALTKLVVSIRGGGVGKWGQVPMPPFAGLSEVQAKALATYVLAQ